MTQFDDYLRRITTWLPYARGFFYTPPGRKDLLCYGTGFDVWGVQTNQKAFAAFAVSAALTGDDQPVEEALGMLRFCLESHIEGSHHCSDGRKWGHTWISALGTERMMHAVEAIRKHLTAADEQLLETVLLSEARWLLNEYEIVAGLENSSGRNKPESNLWNGALLFRTAVLYPNAPEAPAFLDKAFEFFVSSISVPEDESSSTVYDGRAIAPYFKGANFFPSFALNHHGYLNVGYMVICLSQIAMLHLWCRERNIDAPEALYHHADDLWRVVKTLTFPDGRLMRIGGATRARYCYCQDYLIPSWLLALDKYADEEALVLEAGWLAQVKREQDHNGDGGFISDRGQELSRISELYYTRLDSDRACSLSMGAWWRKVLGDLNETTKDPTSDTDFRRLDSWHDSYHGSFVHNSADITCSFTWRGAEGPTALYLPAEASDLAEWRHNLTLHVRGEGAFQEFEIDRQDVATYDGGAVTSGRYDVNESVYIAEGAVARTVARVNLLYAVLPDSHTAILIQHAVSPFRTSINEARGLFFQVPNDIWNGNTRGYRWKGESRELAGFGSKREKIVVASDWVEVDGSIRIERVYGPAEFALLRPGRRQIGFKRYNFAYPMVEQGMLYCDEICAEYVDEKRYFDQGEHIADNAFVFRPAQTADVEGLDLGFRIADGQRWRAVATVAENGGRYIALLPLEDIRNFVLELDGAADGSLRDLAGGASFELRAGRAELGDLDRGVILELTTK